MKRLGSVVAKNNHSVLLKLLQTEKCAGCPTNCNKPLIDIFGLRKNLFLLSNKNPHYALIDPHLIINENLQLEQLIHINIDESDLMYSSAWLYLMPLIFCLLGVVLGHFMGQYFNFHIDLSALVGLFLGLLVSAWFLRRKIAVKHLKFRPKVTIL